MSRQQTVRLPGRVASFHWYRNEPVRGSRWRVKRHRIGGLTSWPGSLILHPFGSVTIGRTKQLKAVRS